MTDNWCFPSNRTVNVKEQVSPSDTFPFSVFTHVNNLVENNISMSMPLYKGMDPIGFSFKYSLITLNNFCCSVFYSQLKIIYHKQQLIADALEGLGV